MQTDNTASSRHLTTIRHPRFDVAERPFIVIWEVTRACDLACAHCRAEAMPLRNPAELDSAEARALIDQVAAFGPHGPLFILTGGDPMKRPDLMELVSYAASRHLPVALSPSGTPLLTPAAIAELKAAGLVALSLSVDGAGPAVHDALRGVEGVFTRTMTAWEAALENGLKVQINTTVARRNLADLPALARLVRSRGAMTWSLFLLVPMGRGTTLEPISAAECEDVLNFLYDVGTVIPAKTTEGHHYKRVVLQRTVLERRGLGPEPVLGLGPTYRRLRAELEPWPARPRTRRAPMDVNAGRGFMFISHTGTVHPSGFLALSAGSVRHQPLGDIYRLSRLFREMRDPAALEGRCGRCEFVGVCGGSRSRAFAVTGNPLADDPLCGYAPGSFAFRQDIAALTAENAPGRPPRQAHAL